MRGWGKEEKIPDQVVDHQPGRKRKIGGVKESNKTNS